MTRIALICSLLIACQCQGASSVDDGLTDLLKRTTNVVVATVIRHMSSTADNLFVVEHSVEFKVTSVLGGEFEVDQHLWVNIRGYTGDSQQFQPFRVAGESCILFLVPSPSEAWYTPDRWTGVYPHNTHRVYAIRKRLEDMHRVQQMSGAAADKLRSTD